MSSDLENTGGSRANPVGQKGYTGNRAGRPKKGTALTDLLKKHLGKKAEGEVVTRKQALVEELYNRAVGHWVTNGESKTYVPGDPIVLKYVFDRVDGKPDVTQRIIDDTLPQVVIVPPKGAS